MAFKIQETAENKDCLLANVPVSVTSIQCGVIQHFYFGSLEFSWLVTHGHECDRHQQGPPFVGWNPFASCSI
jgi:hypothetical protein